MKDAGWTRRLAILMVVDMGAHATIDDVLAQSEVVGEFQTSTVSADGGSHGCASVLAATINGGVMSKTSLCLLNIAGSVVVAAFSAAAQSGSAGDLYRIASGSYDRCCGIGGDIVSALPSDDQAFVRFMVNSQQHVASMAFLGKDLQTIFSIVPCPAGPPIEFGFDFGLIFSDRVVFHVDPGPLPYAIYWNYTVSNSPNRLLIEGVLGTAHQNCVDVPTQYRHHNVVANAVPRPRLRITEYSKEGALLFIQGNAGWTNVLEASADLVSWTSISTNTMPYTRCAECPYVLVRDGTAADLHHRFYRCSERP